MGEFVKVMYVACNPSGESELMLEREITELQRRAINAAGEPVEFLFFPELSVEELPLEISKNRPDILHVSAHGDKGILALANSEGAEVVLTGEILLHFIDKEYSPLLVYLNACNSDKIAQELTVKVSMAIGTTAPITNRAAIASARLFYERLLSGGTVDEAFKSGKYMIEALQSSEATSMLFTNGNVDPSKTRPYQRPRIVARSKNNLFKPDKSDRFKLEWGVIGCHKNTIQLVFFTVDETFIDEKRKDKQTDEAFLASQLCRVIRRTPVRGVLWSNEPEWTYGDHKIFASWVTAGGEIFSIESTLCEALELYYRYYNKDIPDQAKQAILQLQKNDGADLDHDPFNQVRTHRNDT